MPISYVKGLKICRRLYQVCSCC
uniref:Uncharacterized protein n=1 Tax=Rhizophora mucronata TaxID=61149 RepID=A0A2P2NUU2_RHIMU